MWFCCPEGWTRFAVLKVRQVCCAPRGISLHVCILMWLVLETTGRNPIPNQECVVTADMLRINELVDGAYCS